MSPDLSWLRFLAEQGNFAALREACLATESNEPAIAALRALALAQLGFEADARELLAGLSSESDLDVKIDEAAARIALGEIEPAVAVLEAARAKNGAHPLLLARLAWCRLHQGQPDEALSLYEQSLAGQPRIAVYRGALRLYLDRRDLERAASCLAQAQAFWATEKLRWPEEQRAYNDFQLDALQIALWTARRAFAEADAWLDAQREALDEAAWCGRLAIYARLLAEQNHHAQADEALRRGLAQYPEQLALMQPLAELAELQGRPLQALAILRRAVRAARKQEKNAVPILVKLAQVALHAQPKLAREAAEQALKEAEALSREPATASAERARPFRIQARLALANVEAHEQNHAAAEARFRDVLLDEPGSIPALQGLGQLCMQLGRIDDAVALFEQVKAIDPARGYAALISARRFPEDDATLQKLEALARRPSLEGDARSSLLFQLAAAWEKRANYDKAFALADEANAASRKLLRYDAKAHRQRCARIRHAFNRALFEHRPNCGSDSELPVFVVGMPRSGTTLVEQILAGHSRIHGAGELGVIPRIIAGLERWERQAGSGRHYPDCIDDLDAKVVAGVAETILSELREYAPEAARVVDKLPHNFESVGLIKFLFPKAKIISVRRDPRDIAVSNFFADYAAKHGGMGFAFDLDWIGQQLADHNLLMHHWQQVFPGEIHEIQYEDLVADPEASARRLMDYLEVEWEPQVLKFNELERPVKTASVWQVRQPIYQTSKAKWLRYEQRLAPLIAATNRKIAWEPIEMVALPEPGWLNQGVDHFKSRRFDEAERLFKQLLHFVPNHAAATFMLGLTFASKGQLSNGIEQMDTALARCPWNRAWRRDLVQACRLAGQSEKADALEAARATRDSQARAPDDLPRDAFATTHAEPMTFAEADVFR